jgi:hypothetical protein
MPFHILGIIIIPTDEVHDFSEGFAINHQPGINLYPYQISSIHQQINENSGEIDEIFG